MMKARRQSTETGSLFKVFKDLIPPGQKRSVRSEVNFKVEKTQTCNLRLFAKTFKDKLKEGLRTPNVTQKKAAGVDSSGLVFF